MYGAGGEIVGRRGEEGLAVEGLEDGEWRMENGGWRMENGEASVKQYGLPVYTSARVVGGGHWQRQSQYHCVYVRT